MPQIQIKRVCYAVNQINIWEFTDPVHSGARYHRSDRKNADLHPTGKAENNQIVIELDTRKRDYHQLFNLKRKVEIHWINERTFDVQELSGFAWSIVYRITTADGYYYKEPGQRICFTPVIDGLSTQRKVSEVVLRLGVFLCIIAGLGARLTSWLMNRDYTDVMLLGGTG